MKSYEQLLPKFSSEPGLIYRDMYVYPNNSVYRGQMIKREDVKYQDKIDQATTEDTANITEYRHGYGIQYWTDGAHYEGQWCYNKAEG